MRRIVFLFIAGLSLLNAFEIQKHGEFVKEIEPDIMSTSIRAVFEDKNKLEIQNVFEKAIKETKNENICTNGSYRISPNYDYIDKKRVFSGYRGEILFECKFQDSKKLDLVISKLDEADDKRGRLKLTLNPIRWIVDEKVQMQADKELELKALYYAKEYRTFLSGVYASKCKIKEVLLNNANIFTNNQREYATTADIRSKTTAPIKSTHIIKYSASYKFECR
mgnify:CR=1 FL=1